ncbi:hypothetical protein MEBOL_001738 [Melittangium boletus DSM 14713]|uniref:Uncharacterized protein n=1 Tax=Melittangium boletus DSM 14713 TaxID=1294270 RepID=A0A250IAV2_9BACT|nr:hypothetical protein MEBOL_001738 [Melittangium boletus DSM 14713]
MFISNLGTDTGHDLLVNRLDMLIAIKEYAQRNFINFDLGRFLLDPRKNVLLITRKLLPYRLELLIR